MRFAEARERYGLASNDPTRYFRGFGGSGNYVDYTPEILRHLLCAKALMADSEMNNAKRCLTRAEAMELTECARDATQAQYVVIVMGDFGRVSLGCAFEREIPHMMSPARTYRLIRVPEVV